MYQKKIPLDIITLNTFLQDNGLLTKVGGIAIYGPMDRSING